MLFYLGFLHGLFGILAINFFLHGQKDDALLCILGFILTLAFIIPVYYWK